VPDAAFAGAPYAPYAPYAFGDQIRTRCEAERRFGVEYAAVSAAEALEQARAAGIRIKVDGNALVLRAPAPPPQSVVSALAEHKAGVLALLHSVPSDWTAEDWLTFFDERAGIAEFDGGLTRDKAEASAFSCCVTEWLNRNTVSSPPARCVHCGESGSANNPLLAHGTDLAGHARLHDRCRPNWREHRETDAIAALVEYGITAPPNLPHDFGKIGRR
jgi:hypothetical protein